MTGRAMTTAVEEYSSDLHRIWASCGAIAERSYYPDLANLMNAVGMALRPQVYYVSELAEQGAGHPGVKLSESVLRMAFGNDFFRSGRFWVPLVLLVIIGASVFSYVSWESLRSGSEIRTESLETGVITTNTTTLESVSSALRNMGLIVGGIVAVLLAMWRSLVAERQADATLRQAQATLSQAQTAASQSTTTLESFLSDRYEQGTRKLESDDLSVRLDGIDALRRLAKEHPGRYHVPVMSRLCSFVTIPDRSPRLGAEVELAMTAIGSRSKYDISLENNENFELDLSGAKLQKVRLNRLDLSGSNLILADLSGGSLRNANTLLTTS